MLIRPPRSPLTYTLCPSSPRFRSWRSYESIMSPLHSAVFDTGKAVMLEPAPDVAALIEKRAIFDALQYDEDADAPTVTHRLFADAIALAGAMGRASCWERGRQAGEVAWVAVSLKKKILITNNKL